MTGVESDTADPAAPPSVKLYVAGDTPDSTIALANVRSAFETFATTHDLPPLEVIDVTESPLESLQDGVFVTPMLRLDHLGKQSTMYGDLSDARRVGAFFAGLAS